MHSPTKTATSSIVFAIVALLYPIGCGPPCGGSVDFDYTEDDMWQNLAPLANMEQQFSASNSRGIVDVTLSLDPSSLARITPSKERKQPGMTWVRTAHACSVASGRNLYAEGTLTATFTPDGGDEQVLISNRAINVWYRVNGYDKIDNGRITLNGAEDLSVELESETGDFDAFELTQFWSQGDDAATLGYSG